MKKSIAVQPSVTPDEKKAIVAMLWAACPEEMELLEQQVTRNRYEEVMERTAAVLAETQAGRNARRGYKAMGGAD